MDANLETTNVETPETPAAGGTVLVSNCVLCGKILTDPESVARGYGPECAHKIEQLGLGDSASPEAVKTALAEHYKSVAAEGEPAGDFMKFKDAVAFVQSKGIPGGRFNKLCGGDRAMGVPPGGPDFQVRFWKGTRYVPVASISEAHIADMLNSGAAARTAAAAEKAKAAAEARALKQAARAEAQKARALKAEERKALVLKKAEERKAAAQAKAEARKGSAAEKAAARQKTAQEKAAEKAAKIAQRKADLEKRAAEKKAKAAASDGTGPVRGTKKEKAPKTPKTKPAPVAPEVQEF